MKSKTGRKLRQRRIRGKIAGTIEIPRLNVFRSNKYLYGSLTDDLVGKTLVSVNDKNLKKLSGKTKTEKAYEAGIMIAEKAQKNKIKKVVFDRAGYKYHGRVKAFAEGARKGGLVF